ncbi:MAG TPA: 23S rRNA (adenine(2503)-C(2))-methyltransferase RlmN [Desulfurivibrionaceae bacterium]|nr:23S rRNA (adenine(2503)-C(2))-methyltransferase RlmN [Desulfurivibrionaceae bacterium]
MIHQGLKPFRAGQIFAWLYRPGIRGFDQMTDIAKEVRAQLAEVAMVSRLDVAKEEHSADGTVKFGLRLADGEIIESVLIPEEERHTLCVSSQVGCAMGCGFCLTGTMGFTRNLTPSEIVGQVNAASDWLAAHGKPPRVNNLVFMGMGEPLLNFDNLITALRILMEQRGHDFSGRRITVSTCGIVPKMRLLGEAVPVNLAISLHAADDAIRDQLMPVNKTYPLDQLLDACQEFPLPPRRRIMMEYILIKDLNDSPTQAKKLIKRLHGIRCKINLLPYNENEVFPFERPPEERVFAFQKTLRDAGITTLVRTSRGSDISAACGQLAVQGLDDEENEGI